MLASEAGNEECVRVLLDRGAQINVQNNVSDDDIMHYVASQSLH